MGHKIRTMLLAVQTLCPICKADSTVLAVVPTIHPEAHDTTELRQCVDCRHWWHSPKPNQADLAELYAQGSPYVVSADGRQSYQQKSQATRPDAFHQFVLSNIRPAKDNWYLEIGAGGGQLLKRFQTLGYRCYGVDPAQWVNDPAIVPSLDQVPANIGFNVIVLQDVLEHLDNPVDVLQQLHRRADRSALIFCSFPCKDSRPAQLMRQRWGMIRPWGHLHYFSIESMRRMLMATEWALQEFRLASVVPLHRQLLAGNIKGLAFALLRGGKDQLYVMALAQ